MDVPPQPAVLSEATLMIQPSIVDRLDFRSVFGTERPVEVELGAGDGSFLIEYAARKPERNFLGVERLLGRLRKIDRKARRRGLDNVRALRLEAAYVVEWMIPMASVYAIHVYFPDPWPKRRHWRRRLINLTFAAVAWKALRPGGILYLRTDHPGYFDQMMEVMGLCRSFSRTNEPPDLLEVTTDFERGFQAKGIPTLHAAFQRPLNEAEWVAPPVEGYEHLHAPSFPELAVEEAMEAECDTTEDSDDRLPTENTTYGALPGPGEDADEGATMENPHPSPEQVATPSTSNRIDTLPMSSV